MHTMIRAPRSTSGKTTGTRTGLRPRHGSSELPEPEERQRLRDAWWTLTGREDFAGTLHLPMLTGSMAPAIPVGSELHIVAPAQRPFGNGDVVVFQRDEKLVAHRLVLCLGTGPGALCYEKGDLNADGGWIRRRDVLGVVADRVPPPDAPRVAPLTFRGVVWRSLKHGLRAKLRRWLGRESIDAAADEGVRHEP